LKAVFSWIALDVSIIAFLSNLYFPPLFFFFFFFFFIFPPDTFDSFLVYGGMFFSSIPGSAHTVVLSTSLHLSLTLRKAPGSRFVPQTFFRYRGENPCAPPPTQFPREQAVAFFFPPAVFIGSFFPPGPVCFVYVRLIPFPAPVRESCNVYLGLSAGLAFASAWCFPLPALFRSWLAGSLT